MAALTWNAFKESIDNQLKEAGQSEDIAIWYIDISFPCDNHDMCIPEIGIGDMGLQI